METRTKPHVITGAFPEWFAPFAEANGFLLDALDSNRAGRYSEAQVRKREQRGRVELHNGLKPTGAALAISVAGSFFALFVSFLARPQIPGVVRGPAHWVGTSAKLISFLLLCLALLVAGSKFRSLRKLQANLKQNHIATLVGPVTSRSDFPFSDSPTARTFFYYDMQRVSFQVDEKAHLAFQNARPVCNFRACYVPDRMWLVNLEPV